MRSLFIVLCMLFMSSISYAKNIMNFSTKWYVSYELGEKSNKSYNKFKVSRGYLTLKLKPIKWFQPRITFDAHQDDSGDFKVRLKYLYGKFIIPVETSLLTNPNMEVGLVHGPWFDFTEKINRYRVEGKLFIERIGILNSADLGVTVGGLIGEKLPKWYRENVQKKYPGKFGSFAFGIYNGGGYHAEEKNKNKVFMSRISLRPLWTLFPYLQISHFFVKGKGNTKDTPEWNLHSAMLSFEHKYVNLTGQYINGTGNQKGNRVNSNGESFDYWGASVFGEVKIPQISSSVMGRFDNVVWYDDVTIRRTIAGYAYHFYKNNFSLLSFERKLEKGKPTDLVAKLSLQIKL